MSFNLQGVSVAPQDWGAPISHDKFRPHQLETILEYLRLKKGQAMITEAKTGSGKSLTAAGIVNPPESAKEHLAWVDGPNKVVVVTNKKSLQEQYESYGAAVVYGRSNYTCAHPDFPGMTCDECPYAPHMRNCEYSPECPYVRARDRAAGAKFAALNYHFWLGVRNMWPEPDYLVLDECHEIPRLVVDHFSVTVTMRHVTEYDLPMLPIVRNKRMTGNEIVGIVSDWLTKSIAAMSAYVNSINPKNLDGAGRRKLKRAKRFGRRLVNTLEALHENPNDWFIRSPRIPQTRGTKPGLLVRPLTAKYHAPGVFLSSEWASIFMSATVGERQAFSQAIGVDDYVWHPVPSNFPQESRLIVDLGAPRMGSKSKNKDYAAQAEVIADAIKGLPPHWSGIIHTKSKDQARYLAGRLRGLGLADRVWSMPEHIIGTDRQQRAWIEQRGRKPNAILIAWSFWAGYDGLEEKFSIVAKTPFPYLGDEFERARMKRFPKIFRWETALNVEQACGRVRRGRPQDYDDLANGFVAGFVAIADTNYRRVIGSYSQDFRDRIIPLEDYLIGG